jgi:hypothetical protein
VNGHAKHWVYHVVAYNHGLDSRISFLLTAADIAQAEQAVLEYKGAGWRAHWSQMVCSTTDAPFFKEI